MENTLGNIKVESKYKIIEVINLKICPEPNKHGIAELTCMLEENSLQDIISTNQDVIKIKDDEKLIFSGVVDKVKLKHVNGIHYITINAITHSIKLDIKKRQRSFQDKTGTYTEIFDKIIKEDCGGDYIDFLTNGSSQNRVILQYDESNWEFLIRLVSHFSGVVVPDLLGDTPKVYIGLINLDTCNEEEYNYTIEKDLIEYDITKQNFTEKPMLDHVIVQIKSDNHYEIGQDINYDNKVLTIFKKEIYSNKDMVEKKYYMRKRNGIYLNFMKNRSFIGLSIDGTILDVQGDKIKTHLIIDESQPIDKANWFTLSAFYTANGGTGLYLMPKKGENVKLYFPEADENKGFIRTINRKDGSSNKKTQDVDKKYLGNDYGKEIKLSPDEVKITAADKGKMEIKMTEDDGMSIRSDKPIKITSEDDITFSTNETSITAEESIFFSVNFSSSTLHGITHFKADEITINGTTKS